MLLGQTGRECDVIKGRVQEVQVITEVTKVVANSSYVSYVLSVPGYLLDTRIAVLSLESLKSLVSLVLGFRGWDSRTQASLDERRYRFWQISLFLPISLPICSPFCSFCSFSPPISRAAPWQNALATRPCSRPQTSPSSEVGPVDEHHRHHMHRNSRDSDPDWSKGKLHRLHLLQCEAQSIPKLERCPARYPQSPQPAAPQCPQRHSPWASVISVSQVFPFTLNLL